MRRLEIERKQQRSKAIVSVRDNGSAYLTLQTEDGYGYPSMEEEEVASLLKTMRLLKKREVST